MSHVYSKETANNLIYEVYAASTFKIDDNGNCVPLLELRMMKLDTDGNQIKSDDNHWQLWVLKSTQVMSLAAQICENGHLLAEVDQDVWREVYDQLQEMSNKFEAAITNITKMYRVPDADKEKIKAKFKEIEFRIPTKKQAEQLIREGLLLRKELSKQLAPMSRLTDEQLRQKAKNSN